MAAPVRNRRAAVQAAPNVEPTVLEPEVAADAGGAADRWIQRELSLLHESTQTYRAHRRKVMAGIAERFNESLLRFCQVRVGSRSAAEDVVQELFAELEPQLDRLEGVDHLRNLLFKMARQRCSDILEARRRDRVVYHSHDSLESLAGEEPDDVLGAVDPERLREAIARLPKLEDRILLSLSLDYRMPLKHVATVLEITEGACKMRRHRARLKLRKILISEDE